MKIFRDRHARLRSKKAKRKKEKAKERKGSSDSDTESASETSDEQVHIAHFNSVCVQLACNIFNFARVS